MAKGAKTGGREKGTPNKLNKDLREMIMGALGDVGGRDYLAKQARENPNAFISLIGKLVPKDITSTDGSLSAAFRALILSESGQGPEEDSGSSED